MKILTRSLARRCPFTGPSQTVPGNRLYIAIYPGGIMGFDWIFLGLGVFADMATYFGGYFERERVPYGSSIP